MFSPNEIAGREYGGDNFAGLFDSVKSIVASVVPSKTIVGKLVGGDTSGAVADSLKLASKATTGAKAQPVQQVGITPVGPAPGGMSTTTMLYIGLGVVALGGILYVMRRK